VLFGAVGMMLMTCSVELLMVFIGLEISSISTYIMAGFRRVRQQGLRHRSNISARIVRDAFFLYGIAMAFRRDRLDLDRCDCEGSGHGWNSSLGDAYAGVSRTRHDRHRAGIQGVGAPFHVWTPDVYQGAPAPVVGFDVDCAESRGICGTAADLVRRVRGHRASLVGTDVGRLLRSR